MNNHETTEAQVMSQYKPAVAPQQSSAHRLAKAVALAAGLTVAGCSPSQGSKQPPMHPESQAMVEQVQENKELDTQISAKESEWLKKASFHFKDLANKVKGTITRVKIYTDKTEFFGGVLEIYTDGSATPKKFTGMEVISPSLLLQEVLQMKQDVRNGLSKQVEVGPAQVDVLRKKMYEVFDIVDGKVEGQEAKFDPSFSVQLGFKNRDAAKLVMDQCTGISVVYSPDGSLSNYKVTYKTPNGDVETRASDMIINFFKP